MEQHKHKFFQIICIRSGEGFLWLDNDEIPIVPGRAFLIKPGQLHGLTATSLVRTVDVKFVVRDVALMQALRTARNYLQEQRAAISGLLERIRSQGERKGIFFREMCAAYLVQLLIAYLQENGGQPKDALASTGEDATALSTSDAVRKAMDFISEHYREDLDGQRIARSVGASDRQLRHWFRESIDTSPMHYLACYRIQKARELIEYTNYALKEIAEQCGFKSVHHFNHVFSEISGEPPGAWRRRYQEGICKDVYIDPGFSNVILVRREDEKPLASTVSDHEQDDFLKQPSTRGAR